MPFHDEWDHDPSVQMMRQLFSQMERAQERLLRDLDISPFDQRLRDGREHARDLFERARPRAGRKGIVADGKDAASLYIQCLAHALSERGIEVPDEVLQKNGKVVRILKEEL